MARRLRNGYLPPAKFHSGNGSIMSRGRRNCKGCGRGTARPRSAAPVALAEGHERRPEAGQGVFQRGTGRAGPGEVRRPAQRL